MKKILLLALLLLSSNLFAQNNVGIGTNAPDAQALLELKSSDKGILIPRLTTVQRSTMSPNLGTSQEGLMVYDTDSTQFYFWDGYVWKTVGAGATGPQGPTGPSGGPVGPTGPQGPTGVANVQTYGTIGSATTISAVFPSWNVINGLSITLNLTDTATLDIFTNGEIDPTGNSAGFFAYVQLFLNGSPIPNARQTINTVTSFIPAVDIGNWSFAFPLVLPSGTYTLDVRTCRYGSATQTYSASDNRESSLIIHVFY